MNIVKRDILSKKEATFIHITFYYGILLLTMYFAIRLLKSYTVPKLSVNPYYPYAHIANHGVCKVQYII